MAGLATDPRQGKIDVALSVFAQKYRNDPAGYAAAIVAPRVGVAKQSDKYWKFGSQQLTAPLNDLRAATAAAEQIVQTISTAAYLADDHSLARLIAAEERANFEAGDVEQWATEAVTDKLLLALEKRVAALLFVAASWPAGNKITLSGTAQWSDLTNSQPVSDVLTGHLAIQKSAARKANLLLLGPEVAAKLKVHPKITDRIQNVKLGVVSNEDLAAIFEVERVIVPPVIDVTSFVWGKHALLLYATPNPNFQDVSAAKTFIWDGAPGTVGGFGVVIGPYGAPSQQTDELSVHSYYDVVQTSDVSGYFIENAVA